MTGIVTYLPADSALSLPRAGVPNALVVGDCKFGTISVHYLSTVTDANGHFTVACPAGSSSFKGTVKLERATHRVYLYSTLYPANTAFDIPANSSDSIAVVDDAAKIFINHFLWNTAAEALFGRSRAQMVYLANPGVSGSSFYSPSNDRVTIFANATWRGYGEFVVAHEYGHAFHYKAIDRWSSYNCVNGDHSFDSIETASCAYVEGFADFFAAVLLQSRPLATQTINIDHLESSIYRNVGQGIFIEHPFAAVLWDLMDEPSTPDSYPGDDDAVAMTGANIAEIMIRCRTHSPNNYLLSHSFEFLYCAEGSSNNAKWAAPTAHQYGWSLYGYLTYDGGTPTLPNLSVFRSIWKYALYGI